MISTGEVLSASSSGTVKHSRQAGWLSSRLMATRCSILTVKHCPRRSALLVSTLPMPFALVAIIFLVALLSVTSPSLLGCSLLILPWRRLFMLYRCLSGLLLFPDGRISLLLRGRG